MLGVEASVLEGDETLSRSSRFRFPVSACRQKGRRGYNRVAIWHILLKLFSGRGSPRGLGPKAALAAHHLGTGLWDGARSGGRILGLVIRLLQ